MREKRLRPKLFLSLTAVLAFSLAGCPAGGGNGNGSDGGPGGIEPGDYAALIGAAYVAFIENCLTEDNSPIYDRIEPDQGPGFLEENADELAASFTASRQADGVVEDAEAAAACLAVYETYAETCVLPDDEELAPCEEAWTGTLETGADCLYDLQCADGYCDLGEDGCGACKEYAAEGEDCSETDCDDDAYCDSPAEGEATCVAYQVEGGECEDRFCGSNLYCDYEVETPVCVPFDDGEDPPALPQAGDSCDLMDPIGSCQTYQTALSCVVDDNDDLVGECAAVIAVEDGGECNGGPENFGGAGENWCLNAFSSHFCNPDSGLCEDRPGIGDDCSTVDCNSDVAFCDYDFDTEEATCTAYPGEGDACTGECGPGLYCDIDWDNPEMEPGTCVDEFEYFYGAPMCME